MGNAVPLTCQLDCYSKLQNSKSNLYDNITTDHSISLTNSYILKNFPIYKSIQNFFIRNILPIKNTEISIFPTKKNINSNPNNLYLSNDSISNKNSMKNEIIILKEEKEIELKSNYSKLNSILSQYSNEKEKFRSSIKNSLIHKNTQSGRLLKLNTNYLKIFKEDKDVKKKLNNFKLKKENKDKINVSEENPEGFLRPFNISNKNITIISRKRTSTSSIFSNIENAVIIHHPKGYFHYKHLNYKYFGESDENKNKNGFGIITYDDKSKVKGIFKNDKLNGFGKFIDLHSIYTGYYKDSIPNGFGIYKKDNVTTIGDNWLKNNLNGVGYQMFGLNDFYEGEFNKSVKQGIGIYHWNDNTICFGEWNDDKVNGYGVIKYANNNTYMGEFKENVMDGWGEFIWIENKYYCGEYKDGFKHGFGIYVTDFKKINCYIGFWERGHASGIGIKINDNDMIIGIWRDGKRINYIKYWEIKDYLKPNQTKFFKFLHRDIKFFKQYILNLKKNDLFNCQIHIVEDFSV